MSDFRHTQVQLGPISVLYVRGAASRGNVDRYAQGLRAAGARRLTTRLVPEAGHFIPDEQPGELWRHMHEFIISSSAAPR